MVTVEIWSDVACPWCYLGMYNWRSALARFPHADRVRTVWRSFELRPQHPGGQGDKLVDIMLRDWGLGRAEVTSVFDRIRAGGAAHGLSPRPESVRPTCTFDAHRLLHLAADRGVVEPVLDRLFAAHHTDLVDVSDQDVLCAVAVDSGIDATVVREVLRGDRYAAEVRTDERRAPEVGVTAVPSFRIGTHAAVSGALSTEELLSLLRTRWDEATASPPATH